MQELLGLEYSLIVPLVIQERVVGLITTAHTRQSSPPGKREIALITGIARQAAIAIDNANLYQDLQIHAAQLERAYHELKELEERKTQFVQNVSHELRSPFTVIKGYLEMLLEEEVGTLSDRQRAGLEVIAEKTEALGRLIFDIVTMQSVDAKSLDLQEVDLELLFQTALANINTDASNTSFEIDLSPELPHVKADPTMTERILIHLLDNALKFSPQGGVITLRAQPEEEMMRVEVEDQGIGIPENAVPHIFDSFYQVDGSTTRRFGGTGLGLSIARQIVVAHGGQMGVESVEGKGSTFFFTLPLASPASATM
jgi:two-component system phosphate regulon sensor histidine kinase PhoR